MKKLSCQLALGISLSIMISFGGEVLAQSQGINIKLGTPLDIKVSAPPPSPPSPPISKSCNTQGNKTSSNRQGNKISGKNLGSTTSDNDRGNEASESIQLYYFRSANIVTDILNNVITANDCLKNTVVEPNINGNNIIVIYGYKDQRDELKRIIATLDLPRERVNLEMWGIDISSNNPEQLANVMQEVNQEISRTRSLLQDTYMAFADYARNNIKVDPAFKKLFENTLSYNSALDTERPTLSMIDILLLINAAQNPVDNYNNTANNLCELFLGKYPNNPYNDYVDALNDSNNQKKRQPEKSSELRKIPFGNYLRVGLHQPEPGDSQLSSSSKQDCKGNILDPIDQQKALKENLRIRKAVLDFALQYSDLIQRPDKFDPESLQESAENLNSILNPVVDAINRDVEELFIEPTLKRIQKIVKKYKHVEYAEVGKTSIAGLDGIESKVTATTVSGFNETPPLRLDDLLKAANGINPSSQGLLPGNVISFGAKAFPVTSVVDLAAALSQDRSLWRELTSGVSLDITPSVLRNNQSAELKIVLTSGPREAGTQQQGVRPLSRISQQQVSTSVYVNALDLFGLSTFDNQVTIDGGRTYIPVIGTIWQGIFSGIPIFGNLFSWKNPPKNIQHQSIILTNSFIVPTAMGLAHLYQQPPSEQIQGDLSKLFSCRQAAVEKYIINRKREIDPKAKSSGEKTEAFSQSLNNFECQAGH